MRTGFLGAISIGLMVTLAGCASPEQVARVKAEKAKVKRDLIASWPKASVRCKDEKSCNKAFSRAKVFVQQISDMKIQMSDETMVTTYNPTEFGYVGLTVTRSPDVGNEEIIKIQPVCRGLRSLEDIDSDITGFAADCAKKMAYINNNFKAYIAPDA
ncbi:hypothetical protein IB260_21650 [Pseudomonas sp. PDM23]|uniref:hypothetical protein n=1 Tax=unclassified Pseudomonas TaxID=196821 RepID=UPI00177D775E|nr:MULTISPECIES: hypothetical protein [unclassified Pseudomonas]MBD9577945.1 hypothetical protein [Pseudomonas sp. PDM23]MBD9672503.1 hypothetical protein [Pseudomonas sp. PDM21]